LKDRLIPTPKRTTKKSIGILGSGQLALMLGSACHRMGIDVVILAKNSDDCATKIANKVFLESKPGDLKKFLKAVDLVTIENEFVNLKLIEKIQRQKKIFPTAQTLKLIQNKLEQKKNLKKFGLPTSDFLSIKNQKDLNLAIKKLGTHLVLKTSTMGYDGKGTFIWNFKDHLAEDFFKKNPGFIGYAEKFVNFKSEIAVVVARNQKGQVEAFPVVKTIQKNGICVLVKKPDLPRSVEKRAQSLAGKIISKFKGVGVFGVEMFLTKGNKILINELAPRVHNSGHITMDACNVSQFEQHVRVIMNLPLIKPKWTYKNALMINILGTGVGKVHSLKNYKPKSGEFFYWYGKKGNSLNRKLGHINIVSGKNLT
jgi:phosphoribosylaminoimidazole carboxylase PurK protein